jgi:hypothetical protein
VGGTLVAAQLVIAIAAPAEDQPAYQLDRVRRPGALVATPDAWSLASAARRALAIASVSVLAGDRRYSSSLVLTLGDASGLSGAKLGLRVGQEASRTLGELSLLCRRLLDCGLDLFRSPWVAVLGEDACRVIDGLTYLRATGTIAPTLRIGVLQTAANV